MKKTYIILFLSILSTCISAQNDSINYNLIAAAHDNTLKIMMEIQP